MLASIFNSTTIPYLQEAASFAEARHEVLAGNIANIETPGYRTRDLSPEVFQERLKELMQVNASRLQPPVSPGLAGAMPVSPGMADVAALSPGMAGASSLSPGLDRSPSPTRGLSAASQPGVLGGEADEALRKVREASRTLLFHDQSDVGLEEQVMAVTKNQLQHSVALSIMNSQFRVLATVISERV